MALANIMAVIDPTLEQQPAFERALDSAQITGAKLHLYCCVCEKNGTGDQQQILARYEQLLSSLADTAQAGSVVADYSIDWHADWREQIVAAGRRCNADLIIKHSVNHSGVDRQRRITADWNLLRNARCPVLMIKGNTQWQNRRVLAAVIAKPADELHQKLNHQVIKFTNEFAQSYQSEAHFVAAYQDLNHPPDRNKLSQLCNSNSEQLHIDHGPADNVIARVAASLGTDLLIIGTAGRSGLKATVVGNTSERLLDQLSCDMLVLH